MTLHLEIVREEQPQRPRLLCRLGIHSWSAWSQPHRRVYAAGSFDRPHDWFEDTIQRHCVHCNLPHIRPLLSGVHLK